MAFSKKMLWGALVLAELVHSGAQIFFRVGG
jgi:hypothetical protein